MGYGGDNAAMKPALAALCLAVLTSPLAAQDPKPPAPKPATGKVADLAWMAGEWRGKVGDADTVQWHSDPQGDRIAMASKDMPPGLPASFDFGLISERNGAVAFVPFPGGKPGPAFRMTECDGKTQRVVFANDKHDFPKQFVYQRKGNAMTITLTGDEAGKPTTIIYDLKLAATPAAEKGGVAR